MIVIISDNRCTCKRFVRISDCLVSEREGGRRERERERERGREERGGREQREWEGDRETMKSKSYTMLTMTPYAGFDALRPFTPELKFVTGPFFNKRPFANFGRL